MPLVLVWIAELLPIGKPGSGETSLACTLSLDELSLDELWLDELELVFLGFEVHPSRAIAKTTARVVVRTVAPDMPKRRVRCIALTTLRSVFELEDFWFVMFVSPPLLVQHTWILQRGSQWRSR